MKKKPTSEPLTVYQLRELALAAFVDERTFKRALRGEPLLAMTRERIRRVLEERDLAHLLPAEPA